MSFLFFSLNQELKDTVTTDFKHTEGLRKRSTGYSLWGSFKKKNLCQQVLTKNKKISYNLLILGTSYSNPINCHEERKSFDIILKEQMSEVQTPEVCYPV